MRPVTCTQEGWASSGAASSRPEMYCELTLPGSTKVPGRMRPLVLSGKPPRPCRSQPGGDDLVRERGEWAGAQASLTHKSCFCAQRAGDRQHKAQRGATFTAVKRAAGKGLEQAKLNTLHGGVDLEAVLDGLDASTQCRKAAHRGLDVGAGGVAGDVCLAVGKRSADDEAMRHRLGRDGGNGALERGRGDAG